MAKGTQDMDVAKVIHKLVDGAEVTLPAKLVGLDPSTITIEDCKMLSAVMFNGCKIVEMKYLRDRLDAMIKIAENSMITSNAG